jgi:hypothetical protein
MEFFQAIGNSTSGARVAPERFIAEGDTVVSLSRYTATVRTTRANIDTPVAHIFTVKDGQVASWTGFSDTAAVAAAHTGTAHQQLAEGEVRRRAAQCFALVRSRGAEPFSTQLSSAVRVVVPEGADPPPQ